MPELAEVETVRRVLCPQLCGRSIENITVNNAQVIARPAPGEFCSRLSGRVFTGMERRGKFLSLPLDNGDRLTLHLRMTGCLLVAPRSHPLEKHTHLIFTLSDGNELRFSDTRRFGRFWLIESGEEDTFSGISRLGLEPFDPALSAEYLNSVWGSRNTPIKECLLEQNAVCGIGNIYSDEILFAAGIDPRAPARSLSAEHWARLAVNIPQQLRFFVEANAITPDEYLSGRGKDYRNTPFLRVYGHEGKPCPQCGHALEKCVIGGRGSVYCPCCQKL